MNSNPSTECPQHGARDEILGRIRRALSVPAPRPHLSHTAPRADAPEAFTSPAESAPDGSNPLGSNASHPTPSSPQARREGESIGIHPEPRSLEAAAEAMGWAPGAEELTAGSKGAAGKPLSIPLPVLNAGSEFRAWLPPVGDDYPSQVALLKRNLLDLKAEFILVPDLEALPSIAAQLARDNSWSRIARHASPLLDNALSILPPELEILSVDTGFEAAQMEGCQAGWTTCDALIAQTGTLLLSARDSGGRALSVLPPHHIAVATRDDLVADLPTAFERLSRKYGADLPSSLSFVTGPSRTGDIERILVLGAHGPKRLTILLVG